MRNIILRLAYEGEGFAGWQIQPAQRTVEGELRKALEKLHKGPVPYYAAGRTDSKVRASGQIVNFHSSISADSLSPTRYREALNSLLPYGIRVLQAWEGDKDFHARYSARARVYHYHIVQSSALSPAERQLSWYVRSPRLNIVILNSMAQALLGEHDFSSFAAAGDQAPHKIRSIYSANFFLQGKQIVFRICGNAFLWHMVRNIVGTLVAEYSSSHKKCLHSLGYKAGFVDNHLAKQLQLAMQEEEGLLVERMRTILAAKNRKMAGDTAPAHGLCLEQVIYNKAWYQELGD